MDDNNLLDIYDNPTAHSVELHLWAHNNIKHFEDGFIIFLFFPGFLPFSINVYGTSKRVNTAGSATRHYLSPQLVFSYKSN